MIICGEYKNLLMIIRQYSVVPFCVVQYNIPQTSNISHIKFQNLDLDLEWRCSWSIACRRWVINNLLSTKVRHILQFWRYVLYKTTAAKLCHRSEFELIKKAQHIFLFWVFHSKRWCYKEHTVSYGCIEGPPHILFCNIMLSHKDNLVTRLYYIGMLLSHT